MMKRLFTILFMLGCGLTLSAQTQVDAEQIIQTARQYLGKPYKYGAIGPDRFDCSGFVQFCFRKHGIVLPRTSISMSSEGTSVSSGWNKLQTGDLVFFVNNKGKINHVGIYVGTPSANRHEFIHASSSLGITISALEERYWTKHYKCARRINLVASAPIDVPEPELYHSQSASSSSSHPQSAVGSGTTQAESKVDESVVTYKTRRWKTKINRKNREKVVWAE